MIEAYMMIGHHTLVTMARSQHSEGWRTTTYGVTPQCDGLDVAKLVNAKTWTVFKGESYARTHSEAVAAFGRTVAHEIEQERYCMESLAA